MMPEATDSISYFFHSLLLFVLPALIVAALVGTLVSVFQAATTLQEMSLRYAVKLVCLVVLMVALYPALIGSLSELVALCWGTR